MKLEYAFIIILILLVLYVIITDNIEDYTTLSNESLQTLSAVYNTASINVSSITIQGDTATQNIVASKDATINGIIKTNQIIPIQTDTSANPNGITLSGRINVSDKIKTNNIAITGSLCVGQDDNSSICVPSNDLFRMIKAYNLRDKMYDSGAIIYQNIMDCLSSGVIAKSGNPTAWDSTSYASNMWNGLSILNIGNSSNVYPNGLKVTFDNSLTSKGPFDDYSRTLWIRCLNERWITINLYDGSGQLLGSYSSGRRMSTQINPNGSGAENQYNVHAWFPIPISLPISSSFVLVAGVNTGDNGSNCYISGIAFSKNPWNHAMNSALSYTWATNGGDTTLWNSNNWNNDILSQLDPTSASNKTYNLKVPVLFSPYDKLVYIVEHNNNWVGTMHKKVTVNGTQIENFRTTYTNPFATHFNSKLYNRYLAARIPNSLIKSGDRFVTVSIDMTGANNGGIYFREIGTHDYL